jgi:hypothetical protein
MLRLALAVLLVGVTQAHAAPKADSPVETRPETIPKYVGYLDDKTTPAFLVGIASHVDQIVGIRAQIRPSENAADPRDYTAADDDRLFVISEKVRNQFADEGIEVVAPKDEVNWLHGSWVIDGFYVVKSGGVHQGIASFGLQKVNEGEVLLSPKYVVRAVRIEGLRVDRHAARRAAARAALPDALR